MKYTNKFKNIIEEKYNNYQEDERFNRKSQSFEFRTTMHYIQKYLKKGSKILEIGAGTGRYSIALAKMGYDVTAVELVENNLKVLRENAKGLKNLASYQGDILNLQFADNSFDLVLCLGPMYHLFNKKDKKRAISETIRVCKPKGICMFAYITHSSLIWSYGVRKGKLKNLVYELNKNGSIKDIPKKIFSSYFIDDFAQQFEKTDITFLKNVATDGLAPLMRDYIDDGKMDDEDIELLFKLHIATCERLDHQGYSNHMLYICKKNWLQKDFEM